MSVALKVESLNKHFHEPEDFHVLKDISFSVNKGEFVPVIGKSGCGKSTLLYLLSTLDTDYEGKIIINDTLVTGKSQNALAKFRNENIGFVFQFHFLLPEFTALDMRWINLRNYRWIILHINHQVNFRGASNKG